MTLGLNLLYTSLKTDQQRSLAQCMTYSYFIHASIRIAERKLRVCVYTFVLCWVIRPILVLFSVYKGLPKREECNVRHIDDELKWAIIEECEWVFYSPIEAGFRGGVLLQPADLEELLVSSALVTSAPAPDAVPNFAGFAGSLITVTDLLVVLGFHCCTFDKSRISE